MTGRHPVGVAVAVLLAAACRTPVGGSATTVWEGARGPALVVVAGEPADNQPAAARLARQAALELRRRGVPARAIADRLGTPPPGDPGAPGRVLSGAPDPDDLAWLAAGGVAHLVVLRVERLEAAWHRTGRRGALALSATVLPTHAGGRPRTVTVLVEADGPTGATFAALRNDALARLADAVAGGSPR